jgi:hypothetical protein
LPLCAHEWGVLSSLSTKGAPPEGLLHHWAKAVPGFVEPSFASKVTEDDTVYAYLPVEQIKNHVNDPMVHYHLAGKDSIYS